MIAAFVTHGNSFGPIRRQQLVDRRVRLSPANAGQMLPKHWSPKMDADKIVRMREELEMVKRIEELSYGYYTLG